jgi:hypothetical protein
MSMPKFNLKADISEAQLQELETKAAQGTPKFFKPGNYDLKIVNAAYHKTSETDPTWIVVLVELGGIDERKIKTFIMVPTKSLRYNKPGIKDPMVLTYKLRQIIKGLGEDNSVESLAETVAKLFQDPSALVGRVVNVDIGYQGHYVDRVGDGEFKIFERSGKEFKPDGAESVTYPDRDSAIADAASYNITVKGFAEVLKFNAPEADEDDDTNPWS